MTVLLGSDSYRASLRQGLRRVLSPRRWAIALLVALAAGLLGGGMIGFAQAGDGALPPSEPYVPPAEVGTSAPKVGDRGRFAIGTWVDTPEGSRLVGAERLYAAFEWGDPEVVRNADGARRLAMTVRYLEPLETVAPDAPLGAEPTLEYLIDAETHRLLAWRSRAGWQASSNDLIKQNSISAESQQLVYPQPGLQPLLCGLVHALQGTHQAGHASFELFHDCGVGGTNAAGQAFRAVANGSVGGRPTVAFEAAHPPATDSPQLRAWLAPHTPYALRLEIRSRADAGSFQVIRLSSFAAGDGAVGSAAVDPDPVPRPSYRQLLPWGPDDSTIDHPWRLSEAFDFWLHDEGQSELRDFLATHARAFTQYARYDAYEDDMMQEHQWTISVTDGRDVLTRCPYLRIIYYHRAYTGIKSPADDVLAVRDNWYAPCSNLAVELSTPPARAPTRMATVASLGEIWSAYASPEFASRPANVYGFQVSCTRNPCTESGVTYLVGHQTNTIFREPNVEGILSSPPGQVPAVRKNNETYESSLLRVDGQGRAKDVTETRESVVEDVIDPTPAPLQPRGVKVESSLSEGTTVHRELWQAPGGAVAAGLGLLALIAGLVYALWPMVKSAFAVRGYSRVEREDALNHPVRSALMSLIESSPGIHLQELRRRLNLGSGAAIHHINKLLHLGIITQEVGTGHTCYFPRGKVDRRIMAAMPTLKSDSSRRVFSAIAQRSGVNGRDLAAATGLDARTISYHLRRLRDVGLVALVPQGRFTIAQLTEDGKAVAVGADGLLREPSCDSPGPSPDAAPATPDPGGPI